MKYFRLSGLMLLLLVACVITSCSRGGNPVEVNSPMQPDLSIIPESKELSNRSLLAIYDANIDPIAKTFTVTPYQRTADYHYPLTQLYPNCLQITGYGWTPNFWADIKITHPLPYSGIDVFDPRVIAILPANPGVSFNYPIFNCIGNNSVVLEPDGYTKLFDNFGGGIPGNTNPFLAYFKHVEYRRWFSSGTGMTSDTRHWEMHINGFGGPMQFKLVVDVSTNYPNLPQQVIDNASEPVQIETFIDQGMTPSGGSARIEVTLTDWQGLDEIKCKVECPELFTDAVQLLYSHPGTNPNEYVFEGTISNNFLAQAGEYNILIAAWDSQTDIHIFNEAIAVVEGDINFNPVDVTPPWLNFAPYDISIDGNYAYIVGNFWGLNIFDVSNPLIPIWVNWVDIPDHANDVYASDGYAYVALHNSLIPDFVIIDVEPPESAHIVNALNTPNVTVGVHVIDGYAYVADNVSGLQIIDIDPPESAYFVKAVDTPGYAKGVHVSGGYAYVTDYVPFNLQIIDIDPPESAYIVKSVSTPGAAHEVYVSGDYAYVADGYGLEIIDINPPESAYIVSSIDTPGGSSTARGIHVSGEYAYMANEGYGLVIIDINPPESAYIEQFVFTSDDAEDVNVSNGYAFMAVGDSGLQIIDIDSVELAHIVKTVDTPDSARGVHVSGDYAYVTDEVDSGLHIIDIETPESAHYVNFIDTPGSAKGVYVTGGYAYVADGYKLDVDSCLHVIDIEPPGTAAIVKSVYTPGSANDIHVIGGYAYVADGGDYNAGLQIVDLDPLDSAYILQTVFTSNATGIHVTNGYAYIVDWKSGLNIIDIEPPESAHIINTVDTPDYSWGIHVVDGYAYEVGYDGLQIIDIDPPESAHIVKFVETPDYAWSVHVIGGYAYVGDGDGLQIIDIEPPESAYIVSSVDTPHRVWGVYITDCYAYIASAEAGLRIIKLW